MFHAKFGVNYTPYRLQCVIAFTTTEEDDIIDCPFEEFINMGVKVIKMRNCGSYV